MNDYTSIEFTLSCLLFLWIIRILLFILHLIVTWRVLSNINSLKHLNHYSLAYGQGVIFQIPLASIQVILCILSLDIIIVLIPIYVYEIVLMFKFNAYLSPESGLGKSITTLNGVKADYYWVLARAQLVESIIVIILLTIIICRI